MHVIEQSGRAVNTNKGKVWFLKLDIVLKLFLVLGSVFITGFTSLE